ncbi:TPA: hypothetical protein EYP44_00945 [Candidatus Bathyarchaeota archaeon]|nr:hypothetical protein [Candidatus Bathyarchaeota archaeon]
MAISALSDDEVCCAGTGIDIVGHSRDALLQVLSIGKPPGQHPCYVPNPGLPRPLLLRSHGGFARRGPNGLLVDRFWCRYLWPLGAIHGSFNRISLLSLRVEQTRCDGCMACLRNCPAGIRRLSQMGLSTDCTLCGMCTDLCPRGQ